MKHILVAYDTSEQAEKAFDFAIYLADKYKAELSVLAVAHSINLSDETETGDVLKTSLNYYENACSQFKQKAELHYPSVKINFKIVNGKPAEEIVDQSEQLGVDHIVMGHRGKSLFKRWLVGSVAKQVMIYAHCAITIIR